MRDDSFYFGDWKVSPASNCLNRGEQQVALEPRVMEVLTALCKQAGQVLSADDLLQQCWGDSPVGDNPVHKAIAVLRRALGDQATNSIYIETIRKRGYRTIAPVTEAHGAGLGSAGGNWQGGSPYLGLQAFSASHAAVFFGRSAAIERLQHCVHKQVAAGRAQVLILGASGSGKTSLVQAGLLPALARAGNGDSVQAISSTSIDLGDLGEQDLLSALGGTMLDWEIAGQPIFPGSSASSIGLNLQHTPAALDAEMRRALAAHPHARLALFIDRLEAIFTTPHIDDAQRTLLLQALDHLARGPYAVVILACRNDFYPQITDQPLLMAGKEQGAHFDLRPPSQAEIAQIIRLPAQAAQLTFGSGPVSHARLDDLLCDGAAHSPDALPLLQYTLQELYRQRSDSGELSVAAFQQLGGLDGAIGRRAEEVIAGLGEAERASLPAILALLVTVAADEEAITSHRAPWSALGSDAERRLVQALVEQRLFVSQLMGEQPGFGVAHEALLRRWPRVTDWIATHRQALRLRSRLLTQAQRWQRESRSGDLLLPRGKQLGEAQELLDNRSVPLTDEVRALIHASQRRSRRAGHLRNGALASLFLLGILAGLLGLRASKAEGIAQQRRAESEELMSYMVGDFADKLRPLGRLDLLDGVSNKALQYLRADPAGNLSTTARLQHAKALQVIAEVARARGDPKSANEALATADALLQASLVTEPRNAELLKNLGAVAFWRGQIQLDKGQFEQTEVFFKQYRDYSERMSTLDPNDVDAWVELSYARNSLGSLAFKRGDEVGAVVEFQASIALKTQALLRRPDDRTLRANLADSLSWLARAKQSAGDLQGAVKLYEQQSKEVEMLRGSMKTDALWTYRLAIATHYKATVLRDLGIDKDALDNYLLAARLLDDALRQEPNNHLWLRNLLYIKIQLARIALDRNQAPHALQKLEVIRSEISSLIHLDPNNSAWLLLEANAHQATSLTLWQLGRYDNAKQHIEASKQRLSALIGRNPHDLATLQIMANSLLAEAAINEAQGLADEKKRACQKAVATLNDVALRSNNVGTLDPWVRAHLCLGMAQQVARQQAWLGNIGYKQAAYLTFISTYQRSSSDVRRKEYR